MNKLELVKDIVARKAAELTESVVYTGQIQGGRWISTSLIDKYTDLVRVVELQADDEFEPAKQIDNFEFVGGNANRLVYIHQNAISRWLEVAAGDSHWAAAAMLRPGKLSHTNAVFAWEKYKREEADEGLLAVMEARDWARLLKVFGLDEDVNLVQVTVFDLETNVSAKGTLRKVLAGEEPMVFPNSWKRFGALRTEYMAILTTDAHYSPRASVNVQELQYWTHGKKVASWVWEALDEEINRILSWRTSPWLTMGYLAKLGFSPAWNITIESTKESMRGELRKLLRRIKFSDKYGIRTKSTSSALLREGELLLPERAKEFVKIGAEVWVSRNPALPSQGWGRYLVTGFVTGNFVVFPIGDKQWSSLLGGDHDGDDCTIFYHAPVEGYNTPAEWLDLQAVKPSGRKLEGNSIEERVARWKNEVSVNIGTYDLAARRLLAVGKLDEDGRKLYTTAIQTVISLKKRVARLEDQPWYPLLEDYQKLAQQLAGTTWLDAMRDGYKPIGGPEWVIKLWETVQNAITRVNKMTPRLWLTESKVASFAAGSKPRDMWVHSYLQYLKRLKAEALANDDGQTAWEVNKEIREFVHVRGPEYLMELPEEDWKEFSRWAIANMHSSEWVVLCHPEVLEELYQAFGKETMVAMLEGNHHTLKIGDVFEVDETEAIERKFEIDGQTYILLDDTGFIKAGTRYQVTRVRKQVVEFVEIQ